jgi:M6 family metalloprotease-like protein
MKSIYTRETGFQMGKFLVIQTLALFAAHCALAQVPTLTDFGYKQLSVNNHRQAPLGTRYCLIVLIDDATNGVFATDTFFYQTSVFNAAPSNNVNGYLLENSCGRFQLIPAAIGGGTGVMGPFTLTAAELNQLATSPGTPTDGSVALSAAVRNGFPLASYDFDNNGNVSVDELMLLVVANKTSRLPGQTSTFTVDLAGKSCQMRVCSVPEYTVTGAFSTVVHELVHNFANMYDLYYFTTYQNQPYTLNCQRTLASDCGWVHLDPWHKMTFGWNEPRIVSMSQGGRFYIPAVQNADPTAPLLLYDPSRGTSEYFLLEYRTVNRAAGLGFDYQLGTNGLFIWHIQQDGIHNLIKTTSPFGFTGPNTTPFANWIEGPPNNATPDAPWGSAQVTPYLRFNDGSQAIVRIRTSPFQPSDNGIYVEVLVDRSDVVTWVDYSPFLPLLQFGTFNYPYHTLQQGVSAVGYAGNMTIKSSGGSPAPIIINKPMAITAFGGPVTLY